MDGYPKHLAPECNGAVKTPFPDWWDRVKEHFPTVPENAAQYWLHEHWGLSPYSYLRSRDYHFKLMAWPSEALWELRSCWCDFESQNIRCLEKGRELVETTQYPTARFMLERGEFPQPIVVLDNRDGQNVSDWQNLPAAYVLIEGHTRFNIALHLQRTGRLLATVKVWLMERVEAEEK